MEIKIFTVKLIGNGGTELESLSQGSYEKEGGTNSSGLNPSILNVQPIKNFSKSNVEELIVSQNLLKPKQNLQKICQNFTQIFNFN